MIIALGPWSARVPPCRSSFSADRKRDEADAANASTPNYGAIYEQSGLSEPIRAVLPSGTKGASIGLLIAVGARLSPEYTC
jgi:hypothetical protein